MVFDFRATLVTSVKLVGGSQCSAMRVQFLRTIDVGTEEVSKGIVVSLDVIRAIVSELTPAFAVRVEEFES